MHKRKREERAKREWERAHAYNKTNLFGSGAVRSQSRSPSLFGVLSLLQNEQNAAIHCCCVVRKRVNRQIFFWVALSLLAVAASSSREQLLKAEAKLGERNFHCVWRCRVAVDSSSSSTSRSGHGRSRSLGRSHSRFENFWLVISVRCCVRKARKTYVHTYIHTNICSNTRMYTVYILSNKL